MVSGEAMPRKFKSVEAMHEKCKKLQNELAALARKRDRTKSQKGRLALIPEAVRITGELAEIEKQLGVPPEYSYEEWMAIRRR
jgi:hypothetical protein